MTRQRRFPRGRGRGRRRRAGEDGLHGGEEARGGELGDDEVGAAEVEAVAEWGGGRGVRRV